jgi:hypothetical protein
MNLDDQIDELYRLPLGDFTEARNRLAKSLADKAAAARVKALAKPTVVPWAVNQLFWKARPAYERLVKAGEALRDVQIAALGGRSPSGHDKKAKSGGADSVQRAAAAHRTALTDAVRQATALAAAAGAHPDADELSRTLESLSLASSRPEHPGRLTTAVRPAGFEALAGVSVSAAHAGSAPHLALVSSRMAPAKTVSPEAGVQKSRAALARERAEAAAERKREEAFAAERRELEHAVKNAERDLERAKAAEVKARHAYDEAGQEREAASARLAEARKRLTQF